MPITKSAQKALRQAEKRAVQNLRRREAYKNVVKQVQKLVAAKKSGEAEALMPMAYKALDKAAKTGVLKPNAASRNKSRLTRLVRGSKAAA